MPKKRIGLLLLLFWAFLPLLSAQQPTKPNPSPGPSFEPSPLPTEDSVLVTLVLKHQQDKNLPEIRRILEAQGFWDIFPPKDCRVLSWTLAMGLGHVVVLQVPVSSIRRLNLAVENGAWGAFNTEFYLSYDYKAIWQEYIERREAARDDRN